MTSAVPSEPFFGLNYPYRNRMRRMPQGYLPIVLTLFVIVMLGLRMSRSMRGRPINPSYLWVRPAILAVILVPMMWSRCGRTPSHWPRWRRPSCSAPAPVTCCRAIRNLARSQKRQDHQQTSPVGVILFILLFAGRFAFRLTMVSGQAPDKIAAHSKEISSTRTLPSCSCSRWSALRPGKSGAAACLWWRKRRL